MAQQHDSKGELRAAFTMRELENAKRSIPTGATGVFIRVTLAIIFMYLIVISYLMLDITGPVFVSILFLVAFFAPSIHQALKHFLEKRRARREGLTRRGGNPAGELNPKSPIYLFRIGGD